MLLPDVNVLVYAYREDAPSHRRFREWLDDIVDGDAAYGLSELVLSGFLRIVTHPRIFNPPSPLDNALAFVEDLRNRPNSVLIAPGNRHWEIFARLSVKLVVSEATSCPTRTLPPSLSNREVSG